MATPDEILDFWLDEPARTSAQMEAKLKRWFGGASDDFDDLIAERFGDDVRAALSGDLQTWEDEPRSCLALIILLDQFTRNVFRGSSAMYAGDEPAIEVAVSALDRRFDAGMNFEERVFLALPILHAEDLELQRRHEAYAETLSAETGHVEDTYGVAFLNQTRKYTKVIERFGRFPHRNEILGRTSTPEEVEFLAQWNAQSPPRVHRKSDR